MNRILDRLLHHWVDQDRPFIVYSGGNDAGVDVPKGCKKVVGDPCPGWLDDDEHYVCGGFCRRNLVGRDIGFRRPGGLYSNFLPEEYDGHPSLACKWSNVRMEHPHVEWSN